MLVAIYHVDPGCTIFVKRRKLQVDVPGAVFVRNFRELTVLAGSTEKIFLLFKVVPVRDTLRRIFFGHDAGASITPLVAKWC